MPEFTIPNSVFSTNAITLHQKEILKTNTKDNEILLPKKLQAMVLKPNARDELKILHVTHHNDKIYWVGGRDTELKEMLFLIYKHSIYNTRKANYFCLTLSLIFTFKCFLYFGPLTFLAS